MGWVCDSVLRKGFEAPKFPEKSNEFHPTAIELSGSMGMNSSHLLRSPAKSMPETMTGWVAPVARMASTMACSPAAWYLPNRGSPCEPFAFRVQPPASAQPHEILWG